MLVASEFFIVLLASLKFLDANSALFGKKGGLKR